ncbi:MAG: metallophosphoesterase [Alistipes senegalensis]|nr:metallophosphoesterase [Bacteroides cellulosilyticus]MCM1352187.1 metallophosphoesterase [Alistipes senegalensis]
MSFILFFVLLFIGAVFADSLFWWRCAGSLHGRRVLGWGLVFSYLPLLAMILLLGLSRDNTTGVMAACMWLFWIWLFLFLLRLVFYLFRGIDLPRLGTVLAVGVAGLLVWGVTVGRTSLRINRIEIFSEKLPASFDGFRIVQLSDMHIGTLVSPKRELQRIVDSVLSLHPDLIVFTGDLVNVRSSELTDRIAAVLRGLQAPYGVISVLGNHDVGVYIKDTVRQSPAESLHEVIAWQQHLGWQVLQDTTVYLSRCGERISVSGISFDPALRKKRHDSELPPARLDVVYRGVPDSLFNLTAVHLPQFWSQVVQSGYGDLTLSGHVHSMQMKIRLFGHAFSPARWLYDRWSGLYSDRAHTLYINDGTGYVAYPMRLGAWPEITLITLRSCE